MYLKTLTENHKGPFSSHDFAPYLPQDGQPGEWLPKVDTLELCESGYHATTPEHLINWLDAEIYEVELRGEILSGDIKVAAQEMRFIRKLENWNERTARLFICWCVRQVWHLLLDERSRNAVEIAERYAEGQADDNELDAARAAAWDAAWAATGSTARAAAGDAAGSTARTAAWAAAGSTARAAAGDAARDAARAAAWAAAWAAAGAAAGAAARAAARDAQAARLLEILGL